MFEVNYVAVLVSAVVSMIVGFLWYSPTLFGNQWSALMGWGKMSEAEMKKKQQEAMPAYMWSFVGALVMAYVLSNVIQAFGDTTMMGGLQAAFWSWLGFVAPVMLTQNMFTQQSMQLFYINAGHQLISMLAMGSVLTWM